MKQIEKRAKPMKCLRRMVCLPLVLACFVASVTPVNAQEVKAARAPLTVLAMMKAESDYLASWRAHNRRAKARPKPSASLLAIYGVTPRLRARVLVNGQEVVFEQGQRRPVVLGSSRSGSLRLRYIKPPCVSFYLQTKRQTLCLPKAGS